MSTPEFAQSASRRIRQRGIASDGITEAYFQEALERVFSLDTGSLGQAGRYDRYGINATDGITMLVERLSRIQNSGVSQGNYVRVQEYLNMQQDLMKQYTNFTPTPSVGLANRELEAVASMRGYTVNENTANDLRTARSAITNPQNDRMRALLYGTVEELMPETAGRADLIKRAINDPNKQGAIMRAYFQKVENMYGGTDTPMGYYAFESILPQMTDKQRDAFIRNINHGTAGEILANGEMLKKGSNSSKFIFSSDAKGYTSDISQMSTQMSDSVYTAIESLGNKLSHAIDKAVQKISSLVQ